MAAKKDVQAQLSWRHTGAGSSICLPMSDWMKFLRNTSWPTSSVPPMSQYSTVGFHLMKVSLCASSVAPPNTTITPRLSHCMGSTLPCLTWM